MDLSELDVDSSAIECAIASVDLSVADRQICEEYAVLFGRRRCDEQDADVYTLLSILCGLRLRPDDGQPPYESITGDDGLSYFTDEQISAIANVAVDDQIPDLRARLCDVVWIRQRSHTHAREAATAYVDSAHALIKACDILGERSRLKRSVQLAASLGRQDTLLRTIVDRIQATAERSELSNCALADILDVLLESRVANEDLCLRLAVGRAKDIRKETPNPLWERRFLELAGQAAGQCRNESAHHEAIRGVAETFEREATVAPSKAVGAIHWEMALHTYRRITDTEDDRSRVHREVLEAQKHIPQEMMPLASETTDLTQLVEYARERIVGKGKAEGLAELVMATTWHEKSYLRQQAEGMIRDYPLQHLFATTRFSSTWKVAVISPGTIADLGDIDEDRLLEVMCQQYRYYVAIVVNGSIEPMRCELLRAHLFLNDDIAEFLQYSPFIPPGRVPFFVIGIQAGLQGRFVESLHVLIPQLEYLLRYHLSLREVVTSRLDHNGIQSEFDLNRLLDMEETEEFLGEDLCFLMNVLLTSRFGFNLRNEMAHGMLHPGHFYSEASVFTWWLILRIVGHPIAGVIQESKRDSEDAESGKE